MARWDPLHISLRIMMCSFYQVLDIRFKGLYKYHFSNIDTLPKEEVWPSDPNLSWQQKNILSARCVYPEELASFSLVLWW